MAGAVEVNRSKALSFARQAIDAGADLFLFHEELLVGCVPNLLELAEPVDGPTTQAFGSLLRGTRSQILYCLTERDQGRCYIAATLVGAAGVRASYRKAHLWWREGGLHATHTLIAPTCDTVKMHRRTKGRAGGAGRLPLL